METRPKDLRPASLDVHAALELIEHLQATLRDLVSQERAISQAHAARRTALVRQAAANAEQRQAESSEGLTTLETEFAVRTASAKKRFEQRQARVQQAAKRLAKEAFESTNEQEGRQKYSMQKKSLEAERQRETELAAAGQALRAFEEQLRGSQERVAALEGAAHRAFSWTPEFRRLLAPERPWPEFPSGQDEYGMLSELGQLSDRVEANLRQFGATPLVRLFRLLPLWLLLGLGLLSYTAAVWILPHYGIANVNLRQASIYHFTVMAGLVLAYSLGKRLGRPAAFAIATDLAKAHRWHQVCLEKAQARQAQAAARSHAQWESTGQQLSQQWQQALEQAEHERQFRPARIEAKKKRAADRWARRQEWVLKSLEAERTSRLSSLQQQATAADEAARATEENALRQVEQALESERKQWRQESETRLWPILQQIEEARQWAVELCPDWSDSRWQGWLPPQRFLNAVRFGALEVNPAQLAGTKLGELGEMLPNAASLSLPLFLTYPAHGSLLFETSAVGAQAAAEAINAVVVRLLSLTPPGKLSLTIIDPAGLGQSFAGLMHLADFEDGQIQSRIWTQPAQIDEQLTALTEHMEKVIQMYLRNEYPTVAEYNAQAGALAEKYHLLVIAGFPLNFSEAAGRRLLNIAASGARCGVFTLIQWDQRAELPHGFLADELRRNSIRLVAGDQGFSLAPRSFPGTRLRLDAPPPPEFVTDFLQRVGESTRQSSRVELPFAQIAPEQRERWSLDTAEELRVPIGRSGATKLQYLALGTGTRQHVLVAGKTGSGKSTLFHVIITNLALWCSPDQVEFYLVDFKKGVEFKRYAHWRLPHARVVAIESDREFGLSVLQRVDEELRRRGELFRKAGVQDLAGYRRGAPGTPLPRVLVLIDEFQEFFTDEDRISQTAAVLLDRIVRQGRAFGVHVLLGSQTLGGAYTLARATLGQMVVRIALQCNEADACLIMDESNSAPRLLSRPGEGIYNDMAGALEGNSPFQTAWLPDEVRDQYLAEVRARADEAFGRQRTPVVFEGNAPADPSENALLQDVLARPPSAPPPVARAWLGAPNSIKGPTEVAFPRQSGSNLLIVGQSEEAALGLPGVILNCLAAQYPVGTVRFVLVESTGPGSAEREFLDRLVAACGHVVLRPKRTDLGEVLSNLAQEVAARVEAEPSQPVASLFVILTKLQEIKLLKPEDEYSFSMSESAKAISPAAALGTLLTDGPERGLHVIASLDTYANATRFLGRKTLGEFHWRVLFQMSAADSASLIDSPEASKLGLHRALLYQEQEGYLEKFRPYAFLGGEG